MRVLLVNPNTVRPPIAPLGLDYLADALAARGHEVEVFDLSFDPRPVGQVVAEAAPGLVGVTLRNTDDCYFAGQDFFLPKLKEVTDALRNATVAPVVAGGVGFSVMPEAVLDFLALDWGIWGEGEFAFPELAERLERGQTPEGVAGLVYRSGASWRRNPALFGDLARLPAPTRSWLDNRRYLREGGQLGFETKRGCGAACIYCVDPVAKGTRVRRHTPDRVVAEVAALAGQGIDHLHTCDSEFNLPEAHAREVCQALVAGGLGERVRWYAYCAPRPFSRSLAALMARAGCAGIDFGVDHSEPEALAALGRTHDQDDLRVAADACRSAGLPFMFDLLLGGPGETSASLRAVVDFMRQVEPTRVGLSVGLRVYPGTALAARATAEPSALRPVPGTSPAGDATFLWPRFYLSPAVGDEIFEIVGSLVGDDPRFLFADPAKRDRNFNYNANQVLVDAIAAGYRGAYWDVLRRVAEDGEDRRRGG